VERLVGLAAYENVSVKASSLPSYIPGEYPFPRVKPVVHQVVEAFGAERVFWGSDASRLACPYAQWRDFFLAELELSYEEKALVMGRGLVSWLGLPSGFGQVVPAPV
jgi:predicted TIM-barrel fold metal-dependent hydrolase